MRDLRRAAGWGAIVLAGLVLRAAPSPAAEAADEAMTLYRQGDGEAAKELLAGYIESNPGDLDARIRYSRLRQALGEGETVRREAAARAEANPDDRDAELLRIITLPGSATKRTAFRDYLEKHPDHARAWEELGRFNVEGWRPAVAFEPLRKAAELAPGRAEPHLLLGLAYRALDEPDEERAALERARELAPDDPGITFEWANTLVHHGREGEAIPMLRELTGVFPRDPLVSATLALACKRSGDEAGFEEAKKATLERRPTFFDGCVYQGIKLRSANQLGEAERLLTMVNELEPGQVEAYMQLGILYRMKKDYESAVRVYTTATHLEEGAMNQLAWRNLGKSHENLGHYDKAEEYIRKSLEVDPDYLLGWVDLAVVLGFRGRFEEAIETWNRVVSMAPYGWEAAQARQTLPYLEKGEIPPKRDETKSYVSPLKGMTREDVEKLKK